MLRPVSRGFTLVESIVAMVIITIAALAMASALGLAFSHSADSLLHTKTVQLAQAYIEEIRARRYDEAAGNGGLPPCSPLATACTTLGPDGETRVQFDDVDDYHGLDESPPRDNLDQPLVAYNGFRVQVAVSYASAGQIAAWGLDDASDAKLIAVTVITPDGDARLFPVVRGNY